MSMVWKLGWEILLVVLCGLLTTCTAIRGMHAHQFMKRTDGHVFLIIEGGHDSCMNTVGLCTQLHRCSTLKPLTLIISSGTCGNVKCTQEFDCLTVQ